MVVEKILKRLGAYLDIPSVVGFEKLFLDYLDMVAQEEKFITQKSNSWLLVSSTTSPTDQLLTIHIDRHGFIVNDSGEVEFAAFYRKHLHGDDFYQEKLIFEKTAARYMGEKVFAYDPQTGTSLLNGAITGSRFDFAKKRVYYSVQWEDVSRANELKPKTPIALHSKVQEKKNTFSSQIDNCISVAVAMQALADGFTGRVLFVAEEEIGRSWQHILSCLQKYSLESQEILTLDTSPFKQPKSLQQGVVVLRTKDEYATFSETMVKRIQKICEEKNISYRVKDKYIQLSNKRTENDSTVSQRSLGRTELGAVVAHTQGKSNGTTLQLPTMYYHTNYETSSYKALENWYAVLRAVCDF